ncbi:tetratricopeptide repeat protein [Hydrogenophaga sp. 5NK40-0174]|uniref:tetratricopeptide repeat protein n=1 Tax=Hydrogenophaga sp. 5NK40-0174 TaxID=3127649 RepID=UPI0031042F8D
MKADSGSNEVLTKARFHRAWSFNQLGDFERAVEDQAEALSLASNASYRPLINYSLYLKKAKRFEESLLIARQASKIESLETSRGSMMTQYHIGWSLFELGRYREAIDAFTKGVPYQPDYAAVYWLRARSYELLGDTVNARQDYEILAELLADPDGQNDLGEWGAEAASKLKSLGLEIP